MNIRTLEKPLGITIGNLEIFEQAFTHRSYLNESKTKKNSNERLEFLGDAILSYVVSNYLFEHFTKLPEGELTNLRSAIVRTHTLADVAKTLKLGDFLLLSKGEEDSGGRNNPSLLADCFEAVVGALFISEGIIPTQKFVERHLLALVPDILERRTYLDYKSQFQEKVQEKMRMSPNYKVVKEIGPDHLKTFFIGAYVEKSLWGEGEGKNKQEAEQQAAKSALEKWAETE